ncbi:cell division protease FtsH [Lutibacter oceani]|uniref:ATP-dependent zinc metalloprotease FtsH n=1 Tax=Lutibacter oceani TaxID=1853311 RepID=A0A3D9S2C0_9FLAO|nr:ATP-dependent zinc metalloprotease FtsH [Lutibacter oceani]REE82782.1 cell division protease FtsH [Lutibacter oceani]
MIENLKNSENNKISENKNPKKPSIGFNPNWMYILFILLMLLLIVINPLVKTKEISWLKFEKTMLSTHDVAQIIVVNKEIAEIYIKSEKLNDPKYIEISKNALASKVGPHYTLQIGSVDSFEDKLQQAQQNFLQDEKVEVIYQNRADWTSVLTWLLPFGILILFWIFMFKGMGKSTIGSSVFNFGKTTAKLIDKDIKSKVTFKDVAGLREAKKEVEEIVDFLKNPETYTKLGAKIPKGVMLVGPTGTGKTLMAKAVAGEAKVPFFSLSGSEFVEMFVGVGASRVRDLFKQAKEKAPSIIFIDEIDAVGRTRSKANAFHANDERENTLNQLLTELDGFGTNTGVIVLAATNRADILDKALLRPGRFDRHIYLELPNKQERIEIFEVHLKPIKKSKNVDVDLLASLSPGFSGADIANICNEAALIAARKKKEHVDQEDFMEARDRVVGGLERKGKIISIAEKQIIANHEAGHAVVSWYLENVDSLVKVSIIPRGKSLGSAWYLPEEHQIITKPQFLDQICALLGGRAAEEIVFNEVSSGALDDLEKVTKQAYNMVAFYGLDEELGPLSFYDSTGENERFLGKPYSENMAKLIDKEVQDLITKSYKRAKNVLEEHKNELLLLAKLLLKKEVVYLEDLEKILGKRTKELPLNIKD